MLNRRKYTKEFKNEAVKLVLEHNYSQAEAANSLGINHRNINRWVFEAKTGKKENHSKVSDQSKCKTNEESELLALRKEIHRLKLEKEILKKAAAFFANELNEDTNL